MIGHKAARTTTSSVGGSLKNDKGSQIHCYGDSGTPAMYYAKKSSIIESQDAYAIGIGYSVKDCNKENNHIPTKFVKITKEILKWLSKPFIGGENIIAVNHEECKHGK